MDNLILFLPVAFILAIIAIVQFVRKKENAKKFLIATFVFLALGAVGSSFAPDTPEEQKAKQEAVEEDKKVSAYVRSQFHVKDSLKSPATAKFSLYPNIISLGDNRYLIKSYVDSQNSFGAMLRTNYECIMKNTGEDNWSLETIEFK